MQAITKHIFIGSDHAGYNMQLHLINYIKLINKQCEIINYSLDSAANVDYPDIAHKLCKDICKTLGQKSTNFGILICGTGIGMSIVANRYNNIRAALCTNEYMAECARTHNDANVLVLGARLIDNGTAINILDKFIKTSFEFDRHCARIEKIDN